jgi:UDP-galactopyranose mutase
MFTNIVKTNERKSKQKQIQINLVEKVWQVAVNCQLDLFDKISIPMLTYGSEIWRCENIDILEKPH